MVRVWLLVRGGNCSLVDRAPPAERNWLAGADWLRASSGVADADGCRPSGAGAGLVPDRHAIAAALSMTTATRLIGKRRTAVTPWRFWKRQLRTGHRRTLPPFTIGSRPRRSGFAWR